MFTELPSLDEFKRAATSRPIALSSNSTIRQETTDYPFWFRLLHAWRTNGRYGLTLPFVVGAEARYRGFKPTVADVRRILGEMRVFEDSLCSLSLSWCPDRGAPVIAVEWFGDTRLIIADSLRQKWGQDEDKILEDVARTSEKRVRDGHFSRVGDPPYATWGDFESDEKDFIDGVIEKNEGPDKG